eukprot:301515_1
MSRAHSNEKQPLQPSGIGSYGSDGDKDIQKQKTNITPVDIEVYVDNYFHGERTSFTILAFSIQIVLIILFSVAVEYPSPLSNDSLEDVSNYVYFQQVNVMMFIGFGYLMTFLRRYGFGAITLNMMLTVLCIQWGLFMTGLIDVLFTRIPHKLVIGIDNLVQGDIAAAVVLISFGAVLGRATPSQLLVMGFLEIILYAVNSYIVTSILHATDVGGSIIIHTFGCYFGLAVSKIIGPPLNEIDNISEYRSDLFSMIGTLFLWLYWPSFNGIFPVSDSCIDIKCEPMAFAQSRAFLNTVFSLCSCTVSVFGMTVFLDGGRFNMVHIQNSTLAGGVAVGAAANLFLTPSGAMGVGLIAAILSTVGFHFITPYIERKFGIWDTCGINNLHGMPGILGGIVSAI